MSNLLFDEHPLVIQPKLAAAVGLNEAIILQQMQYWLGKSDKFREGKKWIYNSYESWHQQFPFFSVMTIRRTIKSLEERNLIVAGNFNKAKFDKTKWYTIDYKRLDDACVQNEHIEEVKVNNGYVQSEHMEVVNLNTPIPETNTETTTDNIYTDSPAEIDQDLQDKTDITQKMLTMINEYYGVDYKSNQKSQLFGLVSSGVTLEQMRDVLNFVVNERTEYKFYPKLKTLAILSKFDGYYDDARAMGYVNGNVPSKNNPKKQERYYE